MPASTGGGAHDPLVSSTHLPSEPHTLQVPVHAELQQTPSAQKPLVHSFVEPHGSPSFF